MPLMMEEGIDVDDLFGDPTLELGLGTAPPTIKGLPQRLDELRLQGCCQKVSWSRVGIVASISQDGQKVFARYFHCSPEDGQWVLSNESPVDHIAEAHSGRTLVHLCFNELGTELAVVDSSGRISTFAISTALNLFSMSRSPASDPEDDGSQPVGLTWLNVNRPKESFHSAAKSNDRWTYTPYRRRPLGPFHPAHKSALISVTRSGHIRLLYQNPDSRWGEASSELKSMGYSGESLTHATMTPTEGSGYLLATYSISGKICLYRVQVKWEPAQWEPKPGVPNTPFPAPNFQLFHIKTEIPSTIFHPPGNDEENIGGLPTTRSSSYVLTHLDILSFSPDTPGGQPPRPYVLAIFSLPLSDGQPHHQDGPSCVLLRWQLDFMTQTLHSSFDDVVSKKTNPQPKQKTAFRKLDDIYFGRHIISVDYAEAGSTLALTHDDSSISFFEAQSMSPHNGLDDGDTVTSMVQAGFNFPIDAAGLYISFSPNNCLAVALDGDWQLHLRYMEHPFGAEAVLYDNDKPSSAMVALALTFGRACLSDTVSDDILAIIIRQLSTDSQMSFVRETYQVLSMNVDYTLEQEKLMNNQYIQKCLSMQAALGFKSRIQQRSLASSVAWISLHLRQMSILLAYFIHCSRGGREAEAYDTEVLRLMHGNIKWALDLSKYLIDDLFEIADNIRDLPVTPSSFSEIANKWATTAEHLKSPSMILVLSSVPRSFLRYFCRGLRSMIGERAKGAANITGEPLHLYSSICNMIEDSPLKLDIYDKILASIDSVVRHAYQKGFGNGDRAIPEREMLITGNIPPVLQPATMTVLTKTMPMVRQELADRMELYLHDYSWVGVGEDKMTELFKRTHDVDIVKKSVTRLDVPHKAEQPKRRCVRCCEVSEDVGLPKPLSLLKMVVKVGVLRFCVCGGMWAVENLDKVVGNGVSAG